MARARVDFYRYRGAVFTLALATATDPLYAAPADLGAPVDAKRPDAALPDGAAPVAKDGGADGGAGAPAPPPAPALPPEKVRYSSEWVEATLRDYNQRYPRLTRIVRL